MNSKTMRALMEHMAEHHRQTRERNAKSGYQTVYVHDTNGVEQDKVDTFWPPENE